MRLIDPIGLKQALAVSAILKDKKTIEQIIDEQPTIEERKKGKWIDYTDDGYVECPFCHSATNCDGNKDELHYCFSCGADMRGE